MLLSGDILENHASRNYKRCISACTMVAGCHYWTSVEGCSLIGHWAS